MHARLLSYIEYQQLCQMEIISSLSYLLQEVELYAQCASLLEKAPSDVKKIALLCNVFSWLGSRMNRSFFMTIICSTTTALLPSR